MFTTAMNKVITGVVFGLCAVVVMHANAAYAVEATTTTTTTTTSAQITLLESLMKQIQELQKKLAELTGQAQEVRASLRADLKEGVSGDDVKKIQELLATDPTLYPEGLKTGYFGKLTSEALKRFQARHELEVTGTMNEETRDLLEEYLSENGNAGIPPGFLRAPGIMKKIEMRLVDGCEHKGEGKAAFCNKLKMKWHMEDHMGTSTEKEHKLEDKKGDKTLRINVDVRTDNARVVIMFPNGTKRILEVPETAEDDIIAAIVDKTELTEAQVTKAIKFDDDEDDDEDMNGDDDSNDDDADDADDSNDDENDDDEDDL